MKKVTKTKTLSLKDLIKKCKFNWVNPDITEQNFPPEDIRSEDFKLYNFGRSISSEDAVSEMQKDGYSPANLYELLSWKDWNSKDFVVGLGSSAMLRGCRRVPCLGDWGVRELCLAWWHGEWLDVFRFLAVRTSSLGAKPSDTVALVNLDTLKCPYCGNEVKVKLEK